MSSKNLMVPLFFAITLHGLSMQATSQITVDDDAGGKTVLVHITDFMPAASHLPNVSMRIQVVGEAFSPPISLRGGQEYQLKANKRNSCKAVAMFGLKFALFDPYVPTRDIDQAAVYWKVDDVGFYRSYDRSKWKLDTAWETEFVGNLSFPRGQFLVEPEG